jgi:NTE family protein
MKLQRWVKFENGKSLHRLTLRPKLGVIVRGGVLLTSLFLLFACARYPVNPKLEYFDAAIHGNPPAFVSPERSKELFLVLAFSGGGTRAAALAYGVLEALAKIDIPTPANALHSPTSTGAHALLDEIDVISSVSGGSFTAAYYGLHKDGIFKDFTDRFLTRNINRALLFRVLWPINWFRLASPRFGRSELAAEYYDKILFDGATFADFVAHNSPYIQIQATDIVDGFYFGFTPYQFGLICSDLAAFPVSRAVAASAAFPGAFTTIILRNYAGICGVKEEPWVTQALEQRDVTSRTFHTAAQVRSYLHPETKPFIYLLDGGIADNLGIRGSLERLHARGGLRETLEDLGLQQTRRMVVILVNAQAKKTYEWGFLGKIPGLGGVLGASSSVMINRYTYETVELLRRYFREWSTEDQQPGTSIAPIDFYIIEVGFNALHDEEERSYFQNIPTTLSLPEETVNELREVAARILYASEPFQKLVHDLGGQMPVSDTKPIADAEAPLIDPNSAELEKALTKATNQP